MNTDDVLRLLVDFFQVHACFDIAESIAEITVDPAWKLLPSTRLESMPYFKIESYSPYLNFRTS